MKKILFPTDFSEAADNAFIYALKIADKMGAEIITLHVYRRPDVRGVNLPHTLQEIYDSIDLEEFEDYRDHVPVLHKIAEKERLSHIPLRNAMIEGETLPTILGVARDQQVDMIIMGTKGAGWVKEIFIGSVAGEVLENASCPVLAIPLDAKFDGKIDKIAIAINGTEEEKKALEKLHEWAASFNAKIYCVHVDTSHTESISHKLKNFKEDMAGLNGMEFIIADDSDIKRAISTIVEEENIDLLAMLTHKRGFFEELFNYSKTKMMSYHTQIPILSIQAHTLN